MVSPELLQPGCTYYIVRYDDLSILAGYGAGWIWKALCILEPTTNFGRLKIERVAT